MAKKNTTTKNTKSTKGDKAAKASTKHVDRPADLINAPSESTWDGIIEWAGNLGVKLTEKNLVIFGGEFYGVIARGKNRNWFAYGIDTKFASETDATDALVDANADRKPAKSSKSKKADKPADGETSYVSVTCDPIENGLTKSQAKVAAVEVETTKRGIKAKVFGSPVTAVLRRLGKDGWELAEVRQLMCLLGIPVNHTTVNIQVSAGRKGKDNERGKLATLSKEALALLKDLRPKCVEA